MSLKEKVAIVTGGSRGIGRAICLQLAKEGCDIAFNYLNSEKDAHALEQEIQKLGVRAKASRVDIKDFDQVKKWIDHTKEEFGKINILINNAGIIMDKALMLMNPSDWHQVIETNLTGMFNASRSCIVSFMKQKEGHIINISSVSGIIGLERQINYSASKGGMNAFTKGLAKEVAAYGIRVNAIAPGYIETDILSHFNEAKKAKIVENIPMQRIGSVDDVAHCVVFLLSDRAAYITGQVIQVDGGLVMR